MNAQAIRTVSTRSLMALLLLGIGLPACSERLARENVFANTETVLGLSIAENPTTQMYEVRLGFSRHELFYVPTSKMVCYTVDASGKLIENPNCTGCSNNPEDTPEVLAEIQIGGDNGRRFSVRQKLAVGKEAVKSGGAIALMAGDLATAQAAAHIAAIVNPSPQRQQLLAELDALVQEHDAQAILDEVAEQEFNKTADNVRFGGSDDELRRLLNALKQRLQSPNP